MKVVLFIISMVIVSLYIGHFSFTVKPFSISLPLWYRPVGLIIVIIGFFILNWSEYMHGYSKGLKDGANCTIEMIKRHIEDNKEFKNE